MPLTFSPRWEAATWAVYPAGRRMATFLTSYDIILSTTLAGPPPKLGYFDQNGDVQTWKALGREPNPDDVTERVTEYLSVTPVHNAAGTPAMNVPLHWTADGLPVGVHFAGLRLSLVNSIAASGSRCV